MGGQTATKASAIPSCNSIVLPPVEIFPRGLKGRVQFNLVKPQLLGNAPDSASLGFDAIWSDPRVVGVKTTGALAFEVLMFPEGCGTGAEGSSGSIV
jgi:hypothetical protein